MMDAGARRQAFAVAFAAQGRSDWDVYKHLSALTKPSFPQCHTLHYLQMATEKIAKAYRIRDTAADVDELVRHHTGFVEFINQFFRCEMIRDEYRGQDAALQTLQRNATALAREIEKLAPATDRLASPENAEYPWERDETILIPCTFDFPNLTMLRRPGGRSVMNLVERAFNDFERLRIQ
ncbi:hypothetical protein WME75_03260 [Sorangium sp. So ce1014]|uniref:hypothetical protein n=1 Tax=Sorangium sp. So ce1014 TaxID=3133326 RepID=UPI003F645AAC